MFMLTLEEAGRDIQLITLLEETNVALYRTSSVLTSGLESDVTAPSRRVRVTGLAVWSC